MSEKRYIFEAIQIRALEDIRRFYILASIISLSLGVGIYFFFRNSHILFFEWMPIFKFFNGVYIPIKHSFFGSVILFNMPDALWILIIIFFLRYLWFDYKKLQNIYIISIYGVAVIIEMSQLSKYIPGTFDILDLVFMGIAAFAEGLLYKTLSKRRSV